MSNENITTDEAVDALDSLRRSVKDLETIRRAIRSAVKEFPLAKPIDAPKTHETLSACLADLIEACAHLSQGDDADRIELSKELATRIIEGVVK